MKSKGAVLAFERCDRWTSRVASRAWTRGVDWTCVVGDVVRDAATEYGVGVSTSPNDLQIFKVCEFAVAMMLWLAKQFGTRKPDFMQAGS